MVKKSVLFTNNFIFAYICNFVARIQDSRYQIFLLAITLSQLQELANNSEIYQRRSKDKTKFSELTVFQLGLKGLKSFFITVKIAM